MPIPFPHFYFILLKSEQFVFSNITALCHVLLCLYYSPVNSYTYAAACSCIFR
ncbi:hypothetical protein BACPEC_03292 [[Bacteroides] pectinophilus ATCC 43243]|uniref:Uncharacterized protein n=1 Tax=[Bacteroides] pectinophilus ATCC 43243 TaxID=483218 RepID=B7AX43_9FIRM|nr:hypothetical protein BACPEC_03292 [[Bacteroides] pectinophilus ATCC 43243]